MTVYLVGAGPGDPGLLTVRGSKLLQQADCVIYDRLVSPSLLDLVPRTAEQVYVGKTPGATEISQDEINDLLVTRGQKFNTVVRLKGGDPYVFGRGGEEVEVLQRAGISFEVVPGITSAIAALTYAGIPVTHRNVSTHVTVVTGHEDPTKGHTDVDWEALARAGGTLVILMGVGHMAEITQRLLAGGLSPDTSVAAVHNGTQSNQDVVRATLATISTQKLQAPSVIVVGDVAALDFDWFSSRSLFGKSVVVTRAREQASELRAQLETLGAEVVELPAIAIDPLAFESPDLDEFSWLVFTSANGVRIFFEQEFADRDARALSGIQVAAIGPGTAAELLKYGVRADLVPERFIAEELAEVFPEPYPNDRVLIVRAEQAREVLPEILRERGYELEILSVYKTVMEFPNSEIVERVRQGKVDAITFTSSSTVDNLTDLLGKIPEPQPKVISIGPITSETAKQRGWLVDQGAKEHTIDGVIEALLRIAD